LSIDAPPPEPSLFEPPRKFQHRYRTHIILFVLTFVTTTLHDLFSGLLEVWAQEGLARVPSAIIGISASNWWAMISQGLLYSIPLLTILTAHEFGHYFACRRYGVDASLPYYLPAPGLLTGTFGAVIRIRERFPTSRALFDIAVAGPIAGFVALLPFLIVGMAMSETRSTAGIVSLRLGDPLLSKAAAWVTLGLPPQGQDIFLHPIAYAAWWGMLVTALNLMPFGQLDGGHISYAVFGTRARFVSFGTLGATLLLTLWSRSWISVAIMMLVMASFLGVRHPQVLDPDQPLDASRKAVAALALLIFVVCFTPVPLEFFFGK
jgi:membrane-associated protease RseP (regulator of RpoE activity)